LEGKSISERKDLLRSLECNYILSSNKRKKEISETELKQAKEKKNEKK